MRTDCIMRTMRVLVLALVILITPGVIDLIRADPISVPITCTWTAPGDDGKVGRVTGYDMRYTTDTLNAWTDWRVIAVNPCQVICDSAGATVSVTFEIGLEQNVDYWIGIKAFDERFNYGGRSNLLHVIQFDEIPPDPIMDLR